MAATSFAGTSSLSFRSGHGTRRKNPKLVVANSVRASYRNSSEDLRVDPKISLMAATSFAGTSSLSFRSGHGTRRKNPKLVVANSVRASYRNSSEDLRVDPKVGALLDTVKWDNKGLVVTIAQNIDTGAILMQGFANKEALAMTISSRKATFYSRSRSSLWTKGETSSNFINVHDIFLDCDRDSIIYLGKPDGPTCHTGSETCYYSSLLDLLEEPQSSKERLASTTLYSLEATISQRKDEAAAVQNGKPSWTKRLLLDRELLSSKVREEAGELIQTLQENEDRSRTASEMADLLYHSMVLLRVKGVEVEEVLEVLRKRFSESGIEEKSRRKKPNNQS